MCYAPYEVYNIYYGRIYTLSQYHEIDDIIIPCLQMRKLRHSEAKELALCPPADKWQSWDPNPGSLAMEFMFFDPYIKLLPLTPGSKLCAPEHKKDCVFSCLFCCPSIHSVITY